MEKTAVRDVIDFDLNAIDSAFIEDPYPTLARLRRDSPVHHNADGSVYLTRHDDCLATYRSRDMLSDKTEAFGQKFGECPLKVHHTTSLIFNDPPYHTTVRKLIAGAFTPRKLAEMERLIEGIVDRLLDRVEDLGELDLVTDFGMMLPTEIISFMLGVPEEYREKLRGYSIAILGALDPVVPRDRMDAGNRAVEEFGAILSDLIDHRRRNPDGAGEGEVLEGLIFGEHDGRRLSQEELVQNCIFLLNAGHETTTSMVGNSTGLFLDHPEQHRRLLDDPSLIGSAVEECLRVESPLQIGNRLAGEDIALPSGAVIGKGTYIHTSIAGANRDPEVFEAPDRFDITRTPNPHIAFITGIHVCLGASLARMEGRIALGRFFERFPKLAANGPRERLGLARFRGYTSLPIRVR
jgi:cytochrome P450